MSTQIAQEQYLLNSQLGNIVVTQTLIEAFDVEDVIRNRGLSQALLLQYLNIGNDIDVNAQLPALAIPSVFRANGVSLNG